MDLDLIAAVFGGKRPTSNSVAETLWQEAPAQIIQDSTNVESCKADASGFDYTCDYSKIAEERIIGTCGNELDELELQDKGGQRHRTKGGSIQHRGWNVWERHLLADPGIHIAYYYTTQS